MSKPRGFSGAVLAFALAAWAVFVPPAHSQTCSWVLSSSVVPGGVLLTWTPTAADHYNIWRGNIMGGPYVMIGSTPAPPHFDSIGLVPGNTYYYAVREADGTGMETCQSNEVGVLFAIAVEVPTLSNWGLAALGLLVAWLAVLRLRRKSIAIV